MGVLCLEKHIVKFTLQHNKDQKNEVISALSIERGLGNSLESVFLINIFLSNMGICPQYSTRDQSFPHMAY